MVAGFVNWPNVIGEFETVHRILDGFNVARCGDGECKIAFGKGYRRQEANADLAQELREVLRKPHPKCLPAIPTMDPKGNKFESWARHSERFVKLLYPEVQYYSAFITRPDSAQWCECSEFAHLLQKIWLGKEKVVVLSEPDSKVLSSVKLTNEVIHIQCPSYESYQFIGQWEKQIVKIKPDVALLSVGPTATALANRLAGHGVWAVDIGSVGGFLARYLEHPLQKYGLQ
jgi:hypothetical protein